MTTIVLPALARPLIEPHLPADADVRWFMTADEAYALAPEAEIGWFDMQKPANVGRAIELATRLKWLSTIYAGLDAFPLDLMRERGTVLTNGVGVNTIAVAEYAVMAVLTAAKGYPDVVRAQDKHEWLGASPGTIELAGTKALIVGYGAIGRAIGERLSAFGVDVTGVRRTPDGSTGVIGVNHWKPRLGEFDWVILIAPATSETRALIGMGELGAMKREAWLINFARGTLVDQAALTDALQRRAIGGAFLDVTDPEPLPADDPLWNLATISMHLSGRAQRSMFQRSAKLFLENLNRYRRGEPLVNQVDLTLGY